MATHVLLSAMAVMTSVFGGANAHDWGMGACPRVEPVKNLAVDKFLGVWYVIEQFDTDSNCMLLNFTRLSETQLRVTKVRQFSIFDQVGLEHTNSYSGTLDMPHEDDLGRLRVKWPLNLAGKGDYIVFDTDYTNYAGIYECQVITSLMHRKSAAILARTQALADEYVQRVKRRLKSFGVSNTHFDKISHSGCRSRAEADINIHVDSDTFRNVMSGTRTGLQDAATSLVDGFRSIAATVSQVGQSTYDTIQNIPGDAGTNVDTGVEAVRETIRENVNTGVENVERALEAVLEEADETVKETQEFVNETIDPGFGYVDPFAGETVDFPEEPINVPEELVNFPDDSINNINEEANNVNEIPNGFEENYYNIHNAEVEPIDGVLRTVVSIDKKKKK